MAKAVQRHHHHPEHLRDVSYLTGVYAPFQDAGTQHAVCDLTIHQTVTHRAVNDPNLRLLQDARRDA